MVKLLNCLQATTNLPFTWSSKCFGTEVPSTRLAWGSIIEADTWALLLSFECFNLEVAFSCNVFFFRLIEAGAKPKTYIDGPDLVQLIDEMRCRQKSLVKRTCRQPDALNLRQETRRVCLPQINRSTQTLTRRPNFLFFFCGFLDVYSTTPPFFLSLKFLRLLPGSQS